VSQFTVSCTRATPYQYVSGTEDSRCPLLPLYQLHVEQKRECPQGTKVMLNSTIDNYRDPTTSRESERLARVDIQSFCFFNACSHYLLTQRSFSGQPFSNLPISCRGLFFTFGRPFSGLPTLGLPFSAPPFSGDLAKFAVTFADVILDVIMLVQNLLNIRCCLPKI